MKKYLFQKAEMKKKKFYSWLKQTLEDAGWENVSSRPSTDFDVFHSKGESGEDELFFQMKEYAGASSTSTLSASGERFFDVKLLMNYTPGEPGSAGILERSNETFRRLQISIATISTESDMTVHYHVNKNRIIVMTEFPVGLNSDSVLFMIGKPDEHLSKNYSDGSMMIFTTTSYNGIAIAVDEADSTRRGSYALVTLENLPARAKNNAGINFISELAVGSNSEGVKALVDGVYVMPSEYDYNTNANRGDVFFDEEGDKYQLFYLATRTGSAYSYYVPTRYMALLVERGIV